jgi:hypothetical protein
VLPPTRRHLIAVLPALAWAGWRSAEAAPDRALLTVGGSISRPHGESIAAFDLARLEGLPQHHIRTATPWHAGKPTFSGPLLRDILKAAGAQGQTLRMTALNDYRVDLPADDADRFDVIVARQIDGRAMSVREKGPLFVMYPFDKHPELRNTVYFSRCIWQLRRIEVR